MSNVKGISMLAQSAAKKAFPGNKKVFDATAAEMAKTVRMAAAGVKVGDKVVINGKEVRVPKSALEKIKTEFSEKFKKCTGALLKNEMPEKFTKKGKLTAAAKKDLAVNTYSDFPFGPGSTLNDMFKFVKRGLRKEISTVKSTVKLLETRKPEVKLGDFVREMPKFDGFDKDINVAKIARPDEKYIK